MQDQRIKALDGVRGTACLLVLVGHYVYDPLVPKSGTWLSYFQRLLLVSTTGVDLFFVLSGFLLGGIILDNLRAINLLRVFYVRRALRIFPLYFAWVFSYFAIVSLCDGHRFKWLVEGLLPFWSYILYVQNFVMAEINNSGAQAIGVSWSLAIEEQFYLLLPACLIFTPKRVLPALVLCLTVLALFLRFCFVQHEREFAAYVLLPCRWDSLFVGVLFAWSIRQEWWRRIFSLRTIRLSLAGAFAVLLTATLAWRYVDAVVWPTLVALCCAIVIIASIEIAAFGRLFCISALTFVGKISYGIYVFHLLIAGLVFGAAKGTAPSLTSQFDLILMICSLVGTFAAAFLSFEYFEKPILAQSHRWKYITQELIPSGLKRPKARLLRLS